MAEGLERVAVYERRVRASLERVWENVLDWEHLPWLHRSSFGSIECHDAGDWGWRATLTSQAAELSKPSTVELLVEPAANRYVTRTVDGAGKGNEIWTFLDPAGEDLTDIRVEFHLCGVRPEHRDLLARGYTKLYEQLWDEDEVMMLRRTSELGRGRGDGGQVALGPQDALRACLPRLVEWNGRLWRIVELDGDLVVHAAACPHWLGPLEHAAVEDGCVTCPWHGYRFDLRSGRSADGRGLRLPPAPPLRVDSDGCVQLG